MTDHHDVVLDTGAGVSVFKNTDHLVDISDDHLPIEIYGLTVTNELLCTSTLGSSEYGDVYVSEHSISNILPYGRLKDSAHAVWQSADDDIFRVQIVEGGKVYQFKRRCGVYVYRMSRQQHSLLSTVRDNVSMYNKRDVERADAAVELFRRLGYPSEQSSIRMIRGGTLLNCDVTVDNTQRAIHIYG